MPIYLKALSYRPQPDQLKIHEAEDILRDFKVASNMVTINQRKDVPWRVIEAVEVAKSARVIGPAGWFVRLFVHSAEDRYHVGIYTATDETVITNVSIEVAEYLVKMIAYYATNRVTYIGPEGLVPTVDK